MLSARLSLVEVVRDLLALPSRPPGQPPATTIWPVFHHGSLPRSVHPQKENTTSLILIEENPNILHSWAFIAS